MLLKWVSYELRHMQTTTIKLALSNDLRTLVLKIFSLGPTMIGPTIIDGFSGWGVGGATLPNDFAPFSKSAIGSYH